VVISAPVLWNGGQNFSAWLRGLGGTWGTAQQIPGTAALGGYALVNSVSCASAGNCGVGGSYTDTSGKFQALVASQTNGTWGAAIEVPGTAALNQFGFASTASVSCASAGNCGAGGYYTDSSGKFQAFVVSQSSGTWGTAQQVPGLAALNQGQGAQVTSVSCASAGNCSAGGYYTDSSGHQQAFVVGETTGTWGTAIEVPGTAALNQGGTAAVTALSCAPAAACSAVGGYLDRSLAGRVFVVNKS
jgi:hypothetical protein